MPTNSSGHGFALITGASRALGLSFTRYLLKNTSLPIVVTTANNAQDAMKEKLSDLPEAKDRVHYIGGEASSPRTLSFLNHFLKKEFPDTPARLVLSLRQWPIFERYPDQISKEDTMMGFVGGPVTHELLFRYMHRFMPQKAFKISETDKCKLPAHAIWALGAGRVASITGNDRAGWYTHHASMAATLQLAKSFDHHFHYKCGNNALALAIDPGTFGTDHIKDDWGRADVLKEDEAVEKLMEVLINMSPEEGQGRGRCWDWKGAEVLP